MAASTIGVLSRWAIVEAGSTGTIEIAAGVSAAVGNRRAACGAPPHACASLLPSACICLSSTSGRSPSPRGGQKRRDGHLATAADGADERQFTGWTHCSSAVWLKPARWAADQSNRRNQIGSCREHRPGKLDEVDESLLGVDSQ